MDLNNVVLVVLYVIGYEDNMMSHYIGKVHAMSWCIEII